MKFLKNFDWIDPLELTKRIPENESHWCLLYSGSNIDDLGNKSFLAFGLKDSISSDKIIQKFENNNDKIVVGGDYVNKWFGYFAYDLKNSIEDLPYDSPSIIELPNLLLMQFQHIIEFDNSSRKVNIYSEKSDHRFINKIFREISEEDNEIFPAHNNNINQDVHIKNIESNMTREEYLEKVNHIIDEIKNGTLYQANLTRKFYGSFSDSNINNKNDFDLFVKLSKESPSPYSCYFKIGDISIISSSPEQFIKSDQSGNVTSRPIKGTAPRKNDRNDDKNSLEKLQNSIKDKSENLMIVDLMRNDFSRGCIKSSVYVEDLFKVNSYKSVHHMSSKINGVISDDISSLEFISNCFPPGSMTGTPKIKAMEICSELEGISRGVYSGCIGWLGDDKSFDTSVVIRTLIIKEDIFEFQVGGAIVYDSNPEDEWMETMYKAKDICNCLNISFDKLKNI